MFEKAPYRLRSVSHSLFGSVGLYKHQSEPITEAKGASIL